MSYYLVHTNAAQSWCQIKAVSLDSGGLLNNLSIRRELAQSPQAWNLFGLLHENVFFLLLSKIGFSQFENSFAVGL